MASLQGPRPVKLGPKKHASKTHGCHNNIAHGLGIRVEEKLALQSVNSPTLMGSLVAPDSAQGLT